MAYDQGYFDAFHQIPAYRLRYPDENVIRFLISNFPSDVRKDKKVLDLGCGCGRHLVLLNELGFQAYGVDGSLWAVRYAKNWLKERGFPAEVKLGLITSLPYDEGLFDGIIEHATLVNNDWQSILRACDECHRVMKVGGVGFFLLKRIKDCAFDQATKIARNTYFVNEDVYISQKAEEGNLAATFRAFSRHDIRTMFAKFDTVRVHTWDTSFKGLNIGSQPKARLTSYFIVVAQK